MEDTSTARTSQVNAELIHLEKEIESLEAVISSLEKRLEPVLMSTAPQDEACESQEKEARVPLAERLDRAHHHLQDQREDLQKIIERIEL